MSKGDVTLKFDGDTAEMVRKILAAVDAQEKLTDRTRKFGEESERSGGKALELSQKITGIASAEALIEKGIEAAAHTFEAYMERMKNKAEELTQKVIVLNTSLGAAGQIANSAEVREGLEKLGQSRIGGFEVSNKEATDTFAAISRSLGSRASAQAKLDATRIAEQGRAAGMGQEDANALGINFANISRQEGLGELSESQRADLAYNASITGGQLDNRALKFLGESHDKQEALRLLMAAQLSNEPEKALDAIIDNKGDPKTRRARENLAAGAARIRTQSLGQAIADAATSSDQGTRDFFSQHNVATDIERRQERGAHEALREQLLVDEAKSQNPILSRLPISGQVLEGAVRAGNRLFNSNGVSINPEAATDQKTEALTGKEWGYVIAGTLRSMYNAMTSSNTNTALKNNSEGQQ